jgi:two-component system cell cycle sensor histidine kinase/response regulator CckA
VITKKLGANGLPPSTNGSAAVLSVEQRRGAPEVRHDGSGELSQEHMRSVLDHVLDGIISTDESGTIQSFNLAAEDIFGYTQAEVIGQDVKLLMPEQIHGAQDSYDGGYLRAGAHAIVGTSREVTGRRRDGSTFPMELAISSFELAGKVYYTGITRDISVRVDEAARVRAILENVPDSIFMVDNLGLIRSINHAGEEMTGYKIAEIIGQPIQVLWPEAQRPQVDELLDKMFSGRLSRATGLEVLGQRKDASIFPIDLALNEFAFGEDHYVIGVCRDATARRDKEERLRAILDNASDAIITVDQDGLVLSFNRAAEGLYGYTEAEMTGQEVFILAHEEERATFADLMRRMCRGEQAKMLGMEGKGQRKDGTTFPLELSLNVFAFGDQHYVIGLYRDTTERKDKEARLRSILDNASDAIITVDERGLVQSFNRAAEGLYGYTEAEITGQEVFMLAHEDERATFADLMQRMCRGEQAKMHGIEGKGQRKDGTTFPLELSLNVFAFGDEHYVIGLYRDTTERKDKEARLRAILDNASDAIFTVDEDGLVQSFNRAAESNFGYLEAEMIGQPIYLLAAEGEREFFRDMVERMCRGEQAQALGLEANGLRKNGSTFPLDISLSEFSLEDRRYVIGISHDATQRKKLEGELRQSQKMEAIGRLAGGVAHDFNNVLTVIIAYSQMTLKRLPEEGKLRDYTTQVLQAGQRAALITQQLLAFSRQQVLAPRVHDLNKVVEETEKMLQRLIGEDITIITSLDPKLSPLLVDQGQIVQVIMNLAVNARDAMPQGGKLSIQTSNFYVDEERARELQDYRPGPNILLSVSDTGVGMTPEIRQRIFEPFFTTKGPGQGTGLGLATVYGIIKQSGGHIEVYSEQNIGTTFKIFFPAVEKQVVEPDAVEVLETNAGQETILLVEDDTAVREVAVAVLEELGYNLLVASGGREALEHAHNHDGKIDMLLTDLIMPEMNGRLVAEAVTPLLPGVKVLYMSGYTDDDVVRHGLITDTVNFLQKPFTTTSLGTKVREVLDA